MADNREEGQEESVQERNTRLREALSNAYTALQAEKSVQSFGAFTFEEAMDAQIERIEGKGTQLRPNELDRVNKILNQVRDAITQVKALPPEAFAKPKEGEDVNSNPEEGDDNSDSEE
jgi:hypothetical protein